MDNLMHECSYTSSGADSIEPGALASNEALARLWQGILAFDFDKAYPGAGSAGKFRDLLASAAGWTAEFTELAILEYRKFILLGLVRSPVVPSVHIDTVWHFHILNTRLYRNFCQSVLGVPFFHHEPSKGGLEAKEFHSGSFDDTLKAYLGLFGSQAPCEIWGERVRTKI